MGVSFLSTFSLSHASDVAFSQLQKQLADSQTEMTTGRLADVGLSLGFQTGDTLSLRQSYDQIQTFTTSNNLTNSRLSASQSALTSMTSSAQTFVTQLLAAQGSGSNASTIATQGSAGLSSFIDMINTSVNGVYLFGGQNTDQPPMQDYSGQPPPPSKQAVDSAFQSAFGMSQSDPNVSSITGSQMQSFLDNQFDSLFQDPNWSSNWSQASDQNLQSRISNSQVIQTSVSANDSAMRNLVEAYTMVADLGTQNLNSDAYQAVIKKATQLAGNAIQGLSGLQATLGTAQQNISDANSRMSLQSGVLQTQISNLESVDPYKASNQVSTLLTQIQTSYELTAKIHQMSLLNYLPATGG